MWASLGADISSQPGFTERYSESAGPHDVLESLGLRKIKPPPCPSSEGVLLFWPLP